MNRYHEDIFGTYIPTMANLKGSGTAIKDAATAKPEPPRTLPDALRKAGGDSIASVRRS